MDTNTDSEKEKTKVGLFDLLKEVSRRLKEEIFLLAFLFALLVSIVVMSTQEFPIWVGVTYIALYLIAVASYLALKAQKTHSQLQKESKSYIEWWVRGPSAFQNPYILKKKRPTLGIVHFEIDFKVKNYTKNALSTNVYIGSPSQAVVFVWDSPRKIRRRRFGIIPYHVEVEKSLDALETRMISPNQEGVFAFHGWYRPHFAFKDFDYRRKIVITYRIYAKSEGVIFGEYIESGDKKIEILFKETVTYGTEK